LAVRKLVTSTYGDLDFTGIDGITDILGVLAIDSAANGESSSQDFLDGTLELTGKRLVAHDASNLNNVVNGDVTRVLDVLLLLAVTRGLLKSLDDQGRGGGNNGNLSLTVLNGQLNSDTETLPVSSTLGNIFSDLLGRKTERTDLGGKGGRSTNLVTEYELIHAQRWESLEWLQQR
jgi:hypothetical protein